MKKIEQYQPMLDEIYADLLAISPIVLECKLDSIKKRTGWFPFIESISVNGFGTPHLFRQHLSNIYAKMTQRVIDAYTLADANNDETFFLEVMAGGLNFLRIGRTLIDVDEKRLSFRTSREGLCFFRSPVVYVNGQSNEDLLLLLKAIYESREYAHAWYTVVKCARSLMECSMCVAWPNHPDVKPCLKPGSTPNDRAHCPLLYVAAKSLNFDQTTTAEKEMTK